jgi:hypothetical protein
MKSPIIAALFVQTDGVYFNQPHVDPWDKLRDARTYTGPWAVVAHPPCHLWVNLAAVNYKRYGHVPAWYPGGSDDGMFEAALNAVRTFGGVLEHPAGSHAWKTFGLTIPHKQGWTSCDTGGWVCEVWQSAYGHLARKRTWLYYVGNTQPFELNWERQSGTHQIGSFDRKKPVLSKRKASATPPAFRDALIELAKHSKEKR